MDQNPAPTERSIVQRIMAADDERSARFAMMEIANQIEARLRMEMTEGQVGTTPAQGKSARSLPPGMDRPMTTSAKPDPSESFLEAQRITGKDMPTFGDVADVIGEAAAIDLADPGTGVAPPIVVYQRPTSHRIVPLAAPFEIDGQLIKSLSFSEPSFQDIDDLAAGRIDGIALRARMAGVSVRVIRALKWSDSEVVTLVVRLLSPDL